MPFSFDEDVKNLWLLLVDCGVVFGASFFAFPSLQEQFFWYTREKQKKALLREIIAYILFFFFCSLLYGMRLCAISPVVRFSWTTAGQDLWLGLKTVVYQIPKLVYLEKFHDVFCYCATRKYFAS